MKVFLYSSVVDFEVVMIVGFERFILFPVVRFFLLVFGFFLVFEVFVHFSFLGIFVECLLFLRFVVSNLYHFFVFDFCLIFFGQFEVLFRKVFVLVREGRTLLGSKVKDFFCVEKILFYSSQ